MKNMLLLVLLICHSLALSGQSTAFDARPIVSMLNERYAATPQGYFTIDARFKFADHDDTITHRGTCYFFRGQKNADSLSQFVVFQDDKPLYAYDGERFFTIFDAIKKVRVTDVQASGGAQRVIRGDIRMDNLIFKNLLYHGRPAFRPRFFESVDTATIRTGDLPLLRLTLRDTTVEAALGDVPNNKIISAYYYDINPEDYQLRRFTGEVWLFDGWQYERKDISPVVPLPGTASLRDYFDPEKMAGEYAFEQYDPTAPVKRETALIAVGATLPEFSLADLSGSIFHSTAQTEGLMLLDFWYKGCFPCQLAMPALERLHQKYGEKGLKVLGINPVDKNAAPLSEWLQMRKISYPTLLDPDKKLPEATGIAGYPLLLLVDARTKKVLYVHTGFSETLEGEIEPVIQEYLK